MHREAAIHVDRGRGMSDLVGREWTKKCETGRKLADDVISQAIEEQNPLPIVAVARRLAERRNDGPLAIGFFTRLAAAVIEPRRSGTGLLHVDPAGDDWIDQGESDLTE